MPLFEQVLHLACLLECIIIEDNSVKQVNKGYCHILSLITVIDGDPMIPCLNLHDYNLG